MKRNASQGLELNKQANKQPQLEPCLSHLNYRIYHYVDLTVIAWDLNWHLNTYGYFSLFSFFFFCRGVKRHFREEKGKYETWKQKGIMSLTECNRQYPAKQIHPLAEFRSKYLETILYILNFVRFRKVRAEYKQGKKRHLKCRIES